MFYGDRVEETRQIFFESWRKYLNKSLLEPLEQQIALVILDHPEYHPFFSDPKGSLEQSFFPELGQENPFMHLGLHLALRDQLSLDRPQGIQSAYNVLLGKYQDPMHVEHMMIEQLAEILWLAQKNNSMPDEALYLSKVNGLINQR